MSRAKQQTIVNIEFAIRFSEVCGTSKPAEVQRLLNIPYQTAKNYLLGRLPNPEMLIAISEQTSCSIDWLLTGRGKKFLDDAIPAGAPILAGQMEKFVRRICVEVINETIGGQVATEPRVVVLQSNQVLSEKVVEEAIARTGEQSQ